ncbi:SusC/RagA family TonB-linked outer membrane protein [Gabonibacter massiliensis]|uniref:SusC/RagA family TonB-linked outer membrane protein n=1 Tax=Gabonibacter massiliensis TaxID=1720195 RepID=UPI00257055CF|nr:SusC/RagA family TonB-linked outer membrane protein [Gabonibacter massiliensis]
MRFIFKRCVLFLFMSFFFLQVDAAQRIIKLTMNMRDVTIDEIITNMSEETSYRFLYQVEEVLKYGKRDLNVKNAALEEVLNQLLKGTSLSYEIQNDVVIITPVKEEKKEDKKRVIKGKVIDIQKVPLPGVTVVIKGTTLGVSTDLDGKFTIEIPKQDTTILVFTFIGMEKVEHRLSKDPKDDEKELVITMKEEVKEVDEVVVTGYANIKKESFTGNAVSVKRDDLLKVSQTNIISALQTFDPSLRIAVNNKFGSDPNAVPELYIRGRSGMGIKELDQEGLDNVSLKRSSLENNPNLPTFIMDGFEVSVQKVFDLDPMRIETITILKDAAATAMYGSRAANGVIVITTVAPKPGTLNVSYSLVGEIVMPDLSDYNIANAREKLEIERLAGCFEPDPVLGSDDWINKESRYQEKMQNILEGVDTYWLGKPLRTAFVQKHTLYLEGGNELVRYGVDFMYSGKDGVMKDSYRNTMNLGFSLDFRLKNKLQIRNQISYGFMKNQESPYGDFSMYTTALPYNKFKDENGNYLKHLEGWGSGIDNLNPLYEASLHNHHRSQYDEFTDNFMINWYITEYFQLKGQFSVQKQYEKTDRFVDPNSTLVSTEPTSENQLAGDLYLTQNEAWGWEAKFSLAYNRSIGHHNVNIDLGVDARSNMSQYLKLQYRGFPSGLLSSPNYAAEVVGKPAKTESNKRMASARGQLNYSYNNIYLLDLSFRFDGSSEYGTKKKVAPFGAFGIGLNIHNYAFMKDNNLFNTLRIAASYGLTGKGNFPAYSAVTMYQSMTDDWFITGYGVKLKYLGNPNLKWERTGKLDSRIEVGLKNGLLEFKFGYYNERTLDLITDVTLPTSSGFSVYKDNMGEVENVGYELDIRSNIIRRKDWDFSVYANMSHNENRMLKISDALKRYNDRIDASYDELDSKRDNSRAYTKYKEGISQTAIFGMKSLGIDPATGDELLLNSDGTVTHEWDPKEQVVIGDPEPKIRGSFGFNLRWKDLTLFTSFMYEYGGQEYNYTLVNDVENANIRYANVDKRVATMRWQKPGDIAPLKNIAKSESTTRPSSRFIQDNHFIDLSAITLSYDFRTEWLKKWGLGMLRIETSASDIARFSTIRQERGTSYPFARSINFSLRATF